LDLVAHGGELAVSARCVVAGIEDQQDSGLPQQVGEPIGRTVGGLGRKVGSRSAG